MRSIKLLGSNEQNMNQTQTWISWITSGDKRKWKEATLALGGLSSESDVDIPSLIDALDSEVDDVVFWCVGALGALGSRSVGAIEKLIQRTDHSFPAIRQASMYALSRIAPNRIELNSTFVRKLSDSSEFVVCDALSTLIRMDSVGNTEIDAIKGCLVSPSQHVAFQAEVALRNIILNSENA
jgi:hypothetical protein